MFERFTQKLSGGRFNLGHEHKSKDDLHVVLYKKAGCPWAAAIMGFLNELRIRYEVRDVTLNSHFERELEKKSGKVKSPSIEIDGEMIADASVEDVADVLEKCGIAA